jgi:NTE family protein
VLITPKLDKIDIRDWKAFVPAVEAGRAAAKKALEGLGKPVTELRRRPSTGKRPTPPISLPLSVAAGRSRTAAVNGSSVAPSSRRG